MLNPDGLRDFIRTAILELGTSACPPYHLAIVIGGTSAEFNLKTVKQASIRALDGLPTEGNSLGHAWRDLKWEAEILQKKLNCPGNNISTMTMQICVALFQINNQSSIRKYCSTNQLKDVNPKNL